MSNYKISVSSELMQNYLDADALGPEDKFLALQTNQGKSLLFTKGASEDGTRKVMYVTTEIAGDKHGWKRADLSSAQIKADFPGGADCKSFAAAQTVQGDAAATIQLAMVVNDGKRDHLYLSLGNSDADTAWSEAPKWVRCPFNAVNSAGKPVAAPEPFQVTGVMIGEATDKEYIVADIVDNPNSPVPLVARYSIDAVTSPSQPAWRPQALNASLEAESYSTCVGRHAPEGNIEKKHPVDGLYTVGRVGGSSVFLYTPLYNIFDASADPSSARLQLTSDPHITPNAIAAVRNPDNTSDLYATQGGNLYYFASTNQADGATAQKLLENRLFLQVQNLFASVLHGTVTVWGLNSSHQVFYTQCPVGELTNPASWSYPLAIMSGVGNLSPYVNRVNCSLTFFAQKGVNELTLALKSPGSGTWSQRGVTLPPAKLKSAAKSFSSYTTRIQVSGPDNQAAAKATVCIVSTSVTSVYINHLYYVVGPEPVYVDADPAGSVTVVEAVSRLDATKFKVSVVDKQRVAFQGAEYPEINPMSESTTVKKRLEELRTVDGLNGAQIKSQRPNGPTRKLVHTDNQTDIQNAANNIDFLWKTHDDLKAGKNTRALLSTELHAARCAAFLGDETPIPVDMGDLLSMLDSKVAHAKTAEAHGVTLQAGETWWEAFVGFWKGVWHFFVRTVEGLFTFIFKVVEEVFAAFKYVFNKIVEVIEDVIEFVKYLFEIDDMRRTKEVFKNLVKRFLEDQVNQIQTVKKEFDDAVDAAIKAIDDWAGIGDLDKLGADGQSKLNDRSEPVKGPTAPGALLAHHFQGNVDRAGHEGEGPAVPKPPTTVMEALERAWENAKRDLGKEFEQLDALLHEAGKMTILDLLKKLMGILGSGALRITRDVMDALFDVLYIVSKAAVELLDHPIYIPVVTDILELFGIPEFSLLDLLCWVAAIPFTIAYKIGLALAGKPESAPFPKDKYTDFLSNETDFQAIVKSFQGTARLALSDAGADAAHSLMEDPDSPIMNDEQAKIVSIALHSSAGFFGFLSAALDFSEAPMPFATVPSWLTYGSGASAVAGGLSRGVANVLVPRFPLENRGASACNRGMTFLFVANKLFWTSPVQEKFGNPTQNPRYFGAVTDQLIVLFSIPWTIWHFVELGGKPAGKKRTIGILDECSSVSSYVARWIYAYLVSGMIEEPDTELALDVIMTAAQMIYGGFQFAEAFVEV